MYQEVLPPKKLVMAAIASLTIHQQNPSDNKHYIGYIKSLFGDTNIV